MILRYRMYSYMEKTVARYVNLFMSIQLRIVACKRACADKVKTAFEEADQTILLRLRDKRSTSL